MKIKKLYVLLLIVPLMTKVYCSDYKFNIFNGTMDFCTMEQMDINYQSSARVINRFINNSFKNVNLFTNVEWLPTVNVGSLIMWGYPTITMAITHEEGHRSILTNQSIGSISQPVFNGHGAAYVKGVTDSTLGNFRDSDKPSFIRMYTAGIESDYVIARSDEIKSFIYEEEYKYIHPDLLIRILSISNYLGFSTYFMAKDNGTKFFYNDLMIHNLELTEEDNELERDICGLDPFGAVHYLFNDSCTFKRYVQWSDMTQEEKNFLFWRVGCRGMYINFLSPSLYGYPAFHIGEDIKLNGGMGYALAPFGDFIEENIYFAYKDYNIALYIREFENYKNWSMGFGLKFIDFSPIEWFKLSAEGNFWIQPEALDFYTDKMVPGGACKITTTFMMPAIEDKAIGFNMGIIYKTAGYLPEVESHNQLWRFTSGITIIY